MAVQVTDEFMLERSGVKYKVTAADLRAPLVSSDDSVASITAAAGDFIDLYEVTAQAAALSIPNPTGTPFEGQMLLFRFFDNGTGQSISWGDSFKPNSATALPESTTPYFLTEVEFRYFGGLDVWVCEAVGLAQVATIPGIVFVGSKSFNHASASTSSVSLTNLKDEANSDVSPAEGDIVLVGYASGSSTKTQPSAGWGVPSGYSAAHTQLWADDDAEVFAQVSYKLMSETPDTSVDIPARIGTSTSVAGTVMVFRNVNLSTPFDVTTTTNTGINGAVPDAPAITPVTDGALIVVFGSGSMDPISELGKPSNLSATTNHFQQAKGPSSVFAVAAMGIYTEWSSGSFNPDTFTGGTSSASGARAAVTLALRPI